MQFLLNQTLVEESELPADLTVLEYLRLHRCLTGTKEGCASGDCGACTVVVARAEKHSLVYESVNSCISLMGELHGRQLITVEHLADGQKLHCVQQALIDCHGSQCGFCTPGFVMSMFAMSKQTVPPLESRKDHIERFLGGNLCRCTGYRPIIDASFQVLQYRQDDQFDHNEERSVRQLLSIADPENERHFYQPTTLRDLLMLKQRHPDIPVVAGCTDFSLEITQRLLSFKKIISTARVSELNYIREEDGQWSIGAACTIETLLHTLGPLNESVYEYLLRYGSTQIRNRATVGGNIGNASPIGDLPPLFIALGATLVLQSPAGKRELLLEQFFVDYKKTKLIAGEVITAVNFPKARLRDPATFRIYKVSKRIDDDISTVSSAFYWMPDVSNGGRLTAAFGGMAAIPKRATALEAAAEALGDATFDADQAAQALVIDYAPIDDARASAGYRLSVAQNLFLRFVAELRDSGVAKAFRLSEINHV